MRTLNRATLGLGLLILAGSLVAATSLSDPAQPKPDDGLRVEYLLVPAHDRAQVGDIDLQGGLEVDVVVTSEESPVKCALVDERSGETLAEARSDGPRCAILRHRLRSHVSGRVDIENVGDETSHVTVVVRQ